MMVCWQMANSNFTFLGRLKEYDISLNDIVALMSDGAAINGAIARESNLVQQQCLAHGIQLAVNSTFYLNTPNSSDDAA